MKTESNNPSWLVPPTQTSEINAKPASQSATTSNPSWLTPPSPRPEAVTYVPPALPIRLQIGRKPTSEEWEDLKTALGAAPSRRLQIGSRHPSLPDVIFLRYHNRYVNGEMWGTEDQLIEARLKRRVNVKQWRKRKSESDAEWKAERNAKFKEMSEKQKARLAASKEAAEEARYGNSKRAKAYRKRRAEKEARDAEARAERLRKCREARAKLPKVIP